MKCYYIPSIGVGIALASGLGLPRHGYLKEMCKNFNKKINRPAMTLRAFNQWMYSALTMMRLLLLTVMRLKLKKSLALEQRVAAAL